MERNDINNKNAAVLRQRAEELALKETGLTPAELATMTSEEIQRMLHEMLVYQLELELQNEELRRAQAELEVAQERYFDLFDLAPVGYCTTNDQGVVLEANLTAATLLGLPREELGQQRFSKFVFRDDQDIYYLMRKNLSQTGKPQVLELRMVRDDKAVFWVRLRAVIAVHESSVEPVYRLTLSDITEHKKAEEILWESEAKKRKQEIIERSEKKYQLVFDNANDAIFIHDFQARILEVNQLACTRLGYTRSEMLMLTVNQIDTIQEAQHVNDRMSQLVETGQIVFQTVHQCKDGSAIPTEVSARRILWDDQPAVISICRDITECRRMERTLQEKNEEIERYFLLSLDLLCIANTDGKFLRVNPEWEKVLGYSVAEFHGSRFLDLVHPEDMDATLKAIAKLEDKEDVLNFENRYRKSDGTYRWIEWRSRAHGNTIYAAARDITKRKKIEDALRESEDRFRLTFNFSPDAVSINRLEDGLYVAVNEGFARITGYSQDDVAGKTSLELDIWENPADRARLVQGLREKGYYENLEARFRRKDGSLITGLMSARVIPMNGELHLISISRDITERKNHEKEQLKIEKLESLGILAGGIAHDFNNLLTGIVGNISFAKVFLDAGHKSYKPLSAAEKAAARAGELAHQLLTFSRGGEPVKKVVSPQHIIKESLSLALHGSNVKGSVDIPAEIHAFEADEGQISQVFHNIIINAAQAMPGGGTLAVTAENQFLSDDNSMSLSAGPYIRLTFADQGCGIPEDDLKRIFDPYFTTKSTGNGLGLASVYSIITRHGGIIFARSVVGQGAAFTILMPSIGEPYADYQTGMATHGSDEHKGGSILVMDDEEMIREIAESILTHLGYTVTTCTSGEEAIELYRASLETRESFRAVIMDLTIPGGVGGKQAAEQILSFSPHASLIVSSGYSNDPIMSNYQDYGFIGAIAKPYSIQNFKDVLRMLPVL
ncbi:MAG: PAS domain S-box protein [Pseudomonadota bacterium]